MLMIKVFIFNDRRVNAFKSKCHALISADRWDIDIHWFYREHEYSLSHTVLQKGEFPKEAKHCIYLARVCSLDEIRRTLSVIHLNIARPLGHLCYNNMFCSPFLELLFSDIHKCYYSFDDFYIKVAYFDLSHQIFKQFTRHWIQIQIQSDKQDSSLIFFKLKVALVIICHARIYYEASNRFDESKFFIARSIDFNEVLNFFHKKVVFL